MYLVSGSIHSGHLFNIIPSTMSSVYAPGKFGGCFSFTLILSTVEKSTCPNLPSLLALSPALSSCLYLLVPACTCLYLPVPACICLYLAVPNCTCLYLPVPAVPARRVQRPSWPNLCFSFFVFRFFSVHSYRKRLMRIKSQTLKPQKSWQVIILFIHSWPILYSILQCSTITSCTAT